MNVLVTGAGGFLGRALTLELLARGHTVRALIRSTGPALDPAPGLQVVRGDLRRLADPARLLQDTDAVLHLAAVVVGPDDARFTGTLLGTEGLLTAMAGAAVKRLVLASSYAVYDWSACRETLTEESPVEGARWHERDGYAQGKIWQERLVRRVSAESDWALTVVRPGFVWGPGHEWVDGVGVRLGSTVFVVGPRTRLPLTHVSNCANAFGRVLDDPRSIGRTYDVVDGPGPTSWTYAGRLLPTGAASGARVPVPYHFARRAVRLVHAAVTRAAERPPRLPSIATPRRFDARFTPLRHDALRLRTELGWSPPYPAAEAVAELGYQRRRR